MSKRTKKLLSLLMALVMMVSIVLPVNHMSAQDLNDDLDCSVATSDDAALYTIGESENENAAQIGDKSYPTLQEAIEAIQNKDAESGSVILLLKNVEENIYSSGVDYTLDMQGYTISASNGSTTRVYTIDGGTVTLKNGIITGGNTATDIGAGMAALSGSILTLESVTITENAKTTGYGGGVYLNGAEANMKACTISDNVAASDGGGIYMANNASLIADGLTISGNKSTGSGTWGGGICMTNSSVLQISNSQISGNSCTSKGGGIYVASTCSITFEAGCVIDQNAASTGAGIYSSAENFLVENGLKVTNNTAAGSSSYLAAAGLTLDSGTRNIVLKNVEISGNRSTSGVGGLSVNVGSSPKPATFIAENCNISDNTGSASYVSAAYIRVVSSDEPAEFINCTFYNNNTGDTICINTDPVKFTGCRIENNTGKDAGAIEILNSSIPAILENTVVTGNIGTETGGILGNLQMTGGALYGNISTDGNGANDLKIARTYVNANTLVPAASEMNDGTVSFAGYIWKDSTHNLKIDAGLDADSLSLEKIESIPGAIYPSGYGEAFCFTSSLPERYVAEIVNASKYETVAEAVENAGQNDVIRLIAGENDNSGYIITENIEIGANKEITLDLNGRTLKSIQNQAIEIAEGATLTLTGTKAGTIETRNNDKYAIYNQGTLVINAPVKLSGISHQGDRLELSGDVQIDYIKLGHDKRIIAGKDFAPENLTFEIAEEDLAALMNWQNAGVDNEVVVTLIEPATGYVLPDELVDSIQIANANGLVVVEKDTNGNIVARTMSMNGVFVDGVNGSDSNSGTRDNPVKTFSQAKKILEQLTNDYNAGVLTKAPEGIYVLNTITVSASEQWNFEDSMNDLGMKLMREPTFTGTLVNVSGKDAILELTDITIDGMGSKIAATGALVTVKSGGELWIKSGAILSNNTCTTGYGGAVSAEAGIVTMDGGEVRGNYGVYAGGIGLNGSSMVMNGGLVTDNSAKDAGGGIGVFESSKLTLNGGTISDNSAQTGGGISVGGSTTVTVGNGGAELIMNGGSIENNISAAEGGGIYIQCENTATIKTGIISGNISKSGNFGGGGIYVNGSSSVDGKDYQFGKLNLTNALISDNHAERGGGLAGCNTSTVKIYQKNGADIFGNTSTNGANQIYIEKNILAPDYFISEYMPNGEPYNWSSTDGTLLAANRLQDDQSTIYLNNNVAGASSASVQIIGNQAANGGGGIGTNGFVQIGDPDGIEISVTKIWEDTENIENTRPEYIRVWLMRKVKETDAFERVSFLEFKKQPDGSWPETLSFKNQPVSDVNGNPYIYTVEEEIPAQGDDSKYLYEDIVTGSVEDGFIITNRLEEAGTGIMVHTEWQDNNDQDGIRPERIIIQLIIDGEVYGDEIELNEENDWSYRWDDLPEMGDHIYTVELVEDIDGYSTKYTIEYDEGSILITNIHIPETTATPNEPEKTDTPDYPDNTDISQPSDVPDTPDKPNSPDTPDTSVTSHTPKSGDAAPIAGAAVVLFVSMGACCTLYFKKKRKTKIL